MLLDESQRRSIKTRNHGEPGVFLGYRGEEGKIVVCFNLRSRRMSEYYHVVFHDLIFPGFTKNADQFKVSEIQRPNSPDPVLMERSDTGKIPVESSRGTNPTGVSVPSGNVEEPHKGSLDMMDEEEEEKLNEDDVDKLKMKIMSKLSLTKSMIMEIMFKS